MSKLDRVMSRIVAGLGLAIVVLAAQMADAQIPPTAHGDLIVSRAGRGRIDLNTGQASFSFKNWEFRPDAATSDGLDPANELVTVGIAEERFLIPVGSMKASKSGKRWIYRSKGSRGIELLKLAATPGGTYKVTLKLAGVDLSALVITDPPVCLSFAVIVGDDDGFTGVSFDRPKPFPSKKLTLPGFCTDNSEWPWL